MTLTRSCARGGNGAAAGQGSAQQSKHPISADRAKETKVARNPLEVSVGRKTLLPIGRALFSRMIALVTVIVGLGLSGCATSWRPIADVPRVALMPSKGEITMRAQPGKEIDGLVPVDVAVANGTDEPYRIEPDQIFAINTQGQRILPIPASQAAAEAGDSNALKAGLTGAGKSAVVGGLAGAATGAAIGAAVGTLVLSPAQVALLGAAIGGSIGAAGGGVYGGFQGQSAAHKDADSQISALSLQPRDANPSYSINGYIFFPKGEYISVEMNLFNEETHQSATRSSTWDGQTVMPPVSSSSPVGVAPAQPLPGLPPNVVAPIPNEQSPVLRE